jgi:hypothetical protein
VPDPRCQTPGSYYASSQATPTSFRPKPVFYLPLLAPYLVLAAVAWWRVRAERRSELGMLAWTWAAVHLAVLAASLVLGRAAAYPRHLTFVQPLAACWVAVGLVEAARRLPVRLGQAAAAGVVWLLSVQGPALANMQSDPRYQSYRYDLAAQFVRSHFRAGDAVVYVPDGTFLAFEYYFRPGGKRLEVRVEPRTYGDAEWIALFRKALEPLGPEDGRVWVVATAPGPPAGESALASALRERGYDLLGHRSFPGLRVTLAARRR